MVNIIADYIPAFAPLPNIAPFTYKDGETYLSTLDNLRTYVNTTLVDFINSNFTNLGSEFVTEVNTLITTVNEQLASDETDIDAKIAAFTIVVNNAVQEMLTGSLTINDAQVTEILNTLTSTTKVLLDSIYATKSIEEIANTNATIINTGRLEGSTLDTRYPQKSNLKLNIKDFGAIGDGVTDDTTAITAAYTTAKNTNAVVFYPPLTYIISSPIDITGTFTEGYGATVKSIGSGTGFNLFKATNGFSIRGLTLDNNNSNTISTATPNGSGIYGSTTTRFTNKTSISDMNIINCWGAGISLQNITSITDALNSPSCQTDISNVRFDNTKYGTFIYTFSDVSIDRCYATNIVNDGFWDYVSLGNTVTNCKVFTAGEHGIVTQYSNGFMAIGNTVSHLTHSGIVVGGGDPTKVPAVNFIIANNKVDNAGYHGIDIDTTLSNALTTPVLSYGTITGNIVSTCQMHGIYLNNSSYVSVTGNISRNNVLSGLSAASLKCSIGNNILINNSSSGLVLNGNVDGYGTQTIGENLVDNNTSNGVIHNFSFTASGTNNTYLHFGGSGSPENVLIAPVGSIYMRTDGATATTLYIKESGGITSAGWAAK